MLYLFAGITNFSGYWGCERCRTRGTAIESKSDATRDRDLSKKHGSYPHQQPQVDQDSDDDDDDGGARQQENVIAAAGKKAPKKKGGKTVKFPQLDAPRRKDKDWDLYRLLEKGETQVSIFIHYTIFCFF